MCNMEKREGEGKVGAYIFDRVEMHVWLELEEHDVDDWHIGGGGIVRLWYCLQVLCICQWLECGSTYSLKDICN